jgi:hypothetical protein
VTLQVEDEASEKFEEERKDHKKDSIHSRLYDESFD